MIYISSSLNCLQLALKPGALAGSRNIHFTVEGRKGDTKTTKDQVGIDSIDTLLYAHLL